MSSMQLSVLSMIWMFIRICIWIFNQLILPFRIWLILFHSELPGDEEDSCSFLLQYNSRYLGFTGRWSSLAQGSQTRQVPQLKGCSPHVSGWRAPTGLARWKTAQLAVIYSEFLQTRHGYGSFHIHMLLTVVPFPLFPLTEPNQLQISQFWKRCRCTSIGTSSCHGGWRLELGANTLDGWRIYDGKHF